MADPVVPDAPGVPPLVRSEPAPPAPTLLTGDTINTVGATSEPKWGLFKNGEPVVFADSVVALEYKQDWDLLDYPVEDGAYETYNKVNTPFEIRLRFASGGSENNRGALLSDISYLAGTLDLYDVATPEVTYSNCNIMHYDYKRTSTDGVGLIIIDVHLRQIRIATAPSFSMTAAPSGADPTNNGAVQTTVATPTQDNMISNVILTSEAPVVTGTIPDEVMPPPTFIPEGTQLSGTDLEGITLFPPNGVGW